MQLYQPSCKEDFLEEVATYSMNNFADDYYNLKIILQTGFACSNLQKLLINKCGASILPTIIPISEMSAESEEAFNIPSKQIGVVSRLEEKIILGNIIHSYKKLNYSLAGSLRLAPSLSALFFEFESNNLSLSELENIPLLSQAQHWHRIYDFLNYASEKWQEELARILKNSRARNQKLMLSAELNRLAKNDSYACLAAGITSNNEMNNDFIKGLLELKNGHVILPPTASYQETAIYEPTDALFGISKLLKAIGAEFSTIPYLSLKKALLIDELVSNKNNDSILLESKIEYFECDNIFQEADLIAIKCQEQIASNPKSTISIVVSATSMKDYYIQTLKKYSINYHDLIGDGALKTNIISFLLIISENICAPFSLRNFINLISHPLINSSQAIAIKRLIIKYNKFASDLSEIERTISEKAKEEDKIWFKNFATLTMNSIKEIHSFSSILQKVIIIAEQLCTNIWLGQMEQKLSLALSEILQLFRLEHENIEFAEFPEIFKEIIDNSYLLDQSAENGIVLCRPSDIAFINFDLVIISGNNEGILPMPAMNSPWINKHMQDSLKMTGWSARFGASLYEFYLNLNNKHVILTRAKKHGSGKEFLASPFLLKLKHILEGKLISYRMKESLPLKKQDNNPTDLIQSKVFPSQISASDVELLIRAPYNFYAKKILGLKKEDTLEENPSLAEFGSFFHLIVETYTKEYDNLRGLDPIESILKISKKILTKSRFPLKARKLWQVKITALAPDFITFDEARRALAEQIYTELKGEMELIISGHNVKITAIADRVEIDGQKRVNIIDYKTGALPSKKDVLSGLSPQLVIYALIMLHGGFGLEAKEIKELLYVKINSAEPYIETSEISISLDDLERHKVALMNLLKYYIEEGIYQIDPSIARYDDYLHLARRN